MKRSISQYANCTPAAISIGSEAQMYHFVDDARSDILELSERIRKAIEIIHRLPSAAPREVLEISDSLIKALSDE